MLDNFGAFVDILDIVQKNLNTVDKLQLSLTCKGMHKILKPIIHEEAINKNIDDVVRIIHESNKRFGIPYMKTKCDEAKTVIKEVIKNEKLHILKCDCFIKVRKHRRLTCLTINEGIFKKSFSKRLHKEYNYIVENDIKNIVYFTCFQFNDIIHEEYYEKIKMTINNVIITKIFNVEYYSMLIFSPHTRRFIYAGDHYNWQYLERDIVLMLNHLNTVIINYLFILTSCNCQKV